MVTTNITAYLDIAGKHYEVTYPSNDTQPLEDWIVLVLTEMENLNSLTAKREFAQQLSRFTITPPAYL